MKQALRFLGYCWAGPTTLLAVVLFLVPLWALRQMQPARWREGAWEWEIVLNSWWYRHWSLAGWWATTLGWVIFFSPGRSDWPTCASHERVHVWQSLWLGPLYLPVWLVLTIIYGYRNNPLEVAAYRKERP